jgi:hypothetical protein
MRIPIWKATLLSLVTVTLFPGLWAMASESLHTENPDFGYRRLNPPGQIRAARVESNPSMGTPTSLVRSVAGQPSPAPSQQFPVLTAFSLMSLGVVGLVAIKRRN